MIQGNIIISIPNTGKKSKKAIKKERSHHFLHHRAINVYCVVTRLVTIKIYCFDKVGTI